MHRSFPSRDANNNGKKGSHKRKQKHPQKKKAARPHRNASHGGSHQPSSINSIQVQARNVLNVIRKGRLSNIPAILDRSAAAGRVVTSEDKEKMKNAMVKRYNFEKKALDLTNFSGDPDLSSMRLQLFRQPFLAAAADIITENIPELQALNLNENKLNMINRLQVFAEKLTQLKILYLAKNKIAMLSSLDIFKNLPIVELFLEGNPFIDNFKDEDEYVSEVRKKFPNLVKLDGKVLGPLIGFDLGEEKRPLPPWRKIFLCDPLGQDIVTSFVQQYFAIYDSDDRQRLLEAYHENAMFSLTATNEYGTKEKLTAYLKVARNLQCRNKAERVEIRLNNLKRGRVSIVALLSELPPTKHDPQSFAADLTFFTPQMIILTITGIFKERNANVKAEYVRVFQKTLIIVPNANGGLCIQNELLHINNATEPQSKKAFKTLIIPKPAPILPPPQDSQSEETVRQQMVLALSKDTNMNLEWSRKCLEETNYDYDRARFVFNELFKVNKIPQEAFSMSQE